MKKSIVLLLIGMVAVSACATLSWPFTKKMYMGKELPADQVALIKPMSTHEGCIIFPSYDEVIIVTIDDVKMPWYPSNAAVTPGNHCITILRTSYVSSRRLGMWTFDLYVEAGHTYEIYYSRGYTWVIDAATGEVLADR